MSTTEQEFMDMVAELEAEIDAVNKPPGYQTTSNVVAAHLTEASKRERQRAGVEIHQKLLKLKRILDATPEDPNPEVKRRCKAALVAVTKRVLVEVFDLDPDPGLVP